MTCDPRLRRAGARRPPPLPRVRPGRLQEPSSERRWASEFQSSLRRQSRQAETLVGSLSKSASRSAVRRGDDQELFAIAETKQPTHLRPGRKPRPSSHLAQTAPAAAANPDALTNLPHEPSPTSVAKNPNRPGSLQLTRPVKNGRRGRLRFTLHFCDEPFEGF